MLTNLQISTIYGRINFQLKVGGGIMNWSLPYFGKKVLLKELILIIKNILINILFIDMDVVVMRKLCL